MVLLPVDVGLCQGSTRSYSPRVSLTLIGKILQLLSLVLNIWVIGGQMIASVLQTNQSRVY